MKPKKKICSNPNCIHAGKEQLETNFYNSGERRRSQCKDCEKAKKVIKAIPEKVVSKPKKKTEIKPELIRCHTKREYDSLMKIYEKLGWERLAGQKPTKYNARSENKKQGNTGYISIQIEDGFCRGDVDSPKFNGLPAIDFKDAILKDILKEKGKTKKEGLDTITSLFAQILSDSKMDVMKDMQRKIKRQKLWILFLIGYGIGSTLYNIL